MRSLFAADSSHLDDGTCAIDVNAMKSFVNDQATNNDISIAAESILTECVFRDAAKAKGNVPVGGSINHVGPYYDLSPSRPQSSICILFYLAQSSHPILLLGQNSRLNVRVVSYSPTVTCASDLAPPNEAACSDLLATLPVGVVTFDFIRTRVPRGPKSVIIPVGGKKISSGTHALLPPSAFSAFTST